MIEHLRRPGVGHIGPDGAGNAVPRSHPHDLAEHPHVETAARVEHVGEPAHRAPEEKLVGDPVEPLRKLHEAPVPLPRPAPRRVTVERGLHLRHISAQIERRTVGEEAPPLWVEPDQVEGLVEVAPGLGEDPPQDSRDREDRRPHVEAVALLREDRRLPPDPRILVAQRHRVTARRQRAGGGQATESGPDDDDPI